MLETDTWRDGEVIAEVVDVLGKERHITVRESKVRLSVISRESTGGWLKIGFLAGTSRPLEGIIGTVLVLAPNEEYSILFMQLVAV